MSRSSTRLVIQITLIIVGYYLLAADGGAGRRRDVAARARGVSRARGGRVVGGPPGRPGEMHTPAPEVHIDNLLLTIVVGVTAFAVADLVLARLDPGQFVDLQTKTDALYFALTTLATVGFGDIHAKGQLARLLVIAQMLFNVVVLAAAFRVLAGAARARRG